MLSFFKTVFTHFFQSDPFQKGAALAYYAVFSIFPILIIVVSVLGLLFGKQAVSGDLFIQLKSVLGNEAALQIQSIIKQHHTSYNSLLTTVLGFGMLLLSASGMFNQIHKAFNSIWGLKAKPKNSIARYLTKHMTSFVLLTTLFFILILSTSFNALLTHYTQHLAQSQKLLTVYEHLSSFVVLTLLLTLMFKFLGDAVVHWKPAVLSGIFTGVLFLLGKILITLIVNKKNLSTSFGSASILALIMLWVYYLSQIIFLGASFLEILSARLKLDITPNANAIKIIQQEVPHDR